MDPDLQIDERMRSRLLWAHLFISNRLASHISVDVMSFGLLAVCSLRRLLEPGSYVVKCTLLSIIIINLLTVQWFVGSKIQKEFAKNIYFIVSRVTFHTLIVFFYGDRTVFRVFDLKKKKKFNGTTHRSTVHCPPQKYVGKNLMFHGRKIPGNNRGSSQQVHFRLKRTAVGKN